MVEESRGEIVGCNCPADDAPGWAALDERVRAVYGEAKPRYFESTEPASGGGDDPLEGISVYEGDDPYPHWHLVGFGMTELFHKEWRKPETSGWGFELTLRVARDPDESTVPGWAVVLLQSLAHYVVVSGRPLAAGQHMDAFGPLDPDTDSALSALCFAEDPALGMVETPNGLARFLQVVGITADERELILDWHAEGVIEALVEQDPMLITDLGRPSILDDPEVAERLRARADAEGSRMDSFFVDTLRWEPVADGIAISIGALHVGALRRGLRRRLGFGRDFALTTLDEAGEPRVLALIAANERAVGASEQRLELGLTTTEALALADAIGDLRGRYEHPSVPSVHVLVEPTEILDDEGGVIEVIG
jgi:suppressor of fused